MSEKFLYGSETCSEGYVAILYRNNDIALGRQGARELFNFIDEQWKTNLTTHRTIQSLDN